MNGIPDDDDRVYIVNTEWLRRSIVRAPEPPMKFEMLPTDDPNKFIYRVTAPPPKFYIKRAKVE